MRRRVGLTTEESPQHKRLGKCKQTKRHTRTHFTTKGKVVQLLSVFQVSVFEEDLEIRFFGTVAI